VQEARTANWAFDVLNADRADVVPSGTPVPTPALLPSLIGIGVAAWRKRNTEMQAGVSEEA
jgi:hypothetical protein